MPKGKGYGRNSNSGQTKSSHGTTAIHRGGGGGSKSGGSKTMQKGNPHQKHSGPK